MAFGGFSAVDALLRHLSRRREDSLCLQRGHLRSGQPRRHGAEAHLVGGLRVGTRVVERRADAGIRFRPSRRARHLHRPRPRRRAPSGDHPLRSGEPPRLFPGRPLHLLHRRHPGSGCQCAVSRQMDDGAVPHPCCRRSPAAGDCRSREQPLFRQGRRLFPV